MSNAREAVKTGERTTRMTFAHPYFLLLLLLLPLLAWLKGKRGSRRLSSIRRCNWCAAFSMSRAPAPGHFLAALRWLALALFIIALAQPRLTQSETKVTASGVDIVVALDLSGSMASEDFEVARRARQPARRWPSAVLKKFIDKRPNDRIGLVAFATPGLHRLPLTLDHDFLLQNLDRLQLGTIDDNRTAIGSALSTAINRLRELKSKSKIVILMTDGQNNAGKIAAAHRRRGRPGARREGLHHRRRHAGHGPDARSYCGGRKSAISMVPVDIDEDTLQKIADKTGGKYYRADNAERFQAIYAEIDKLEKTEAEVKKYRPTRGAVRLGRRARPGLLLLEILLRHTVWRRLP